MQLSELIIKRIPLVTQLNFALKSVQTNFVNINFINFID